MIIKKNTQLKSGFTLLEVIIVLFIISIIAGFSVPKLIETLPDYRLKKAARELLGNIQHTRLQAVRTNSDWGIVFDTANNRYLICSDDGDDNDWSTTQAADNQTIYRIVNLIVYNAGVKYGNGSAASSITGAAIPADNVSYASNVAVFNSRGTGSGGFVYLDNNKNDAVYAVGSLSTGIVMIKRWSGIGWD